MGVDHPEGRLLALQIGEHPHQQRVLHDVGEIAGVEGVAIVHTVVSLPDAKRIHFADQRLDRDLDPPPAAVAIDLGAGAEAAQILVRQIRTSWKMRRPGTADPSCRAASPD